MDLKQMRYFLAVAEERNFTRAAARLHMAQPPLTRHIHALEEELGAALFVRTAKGVELTEAGTALLEEVPNVLSMARRASEKAQRAGRGLIGRLDVGIFGSGLLNVIPVLLARFHKARPEVRIGLHNMGKAEQIEALRERRITVGFNRLVPNEPDLMVETVLRETMLVALPEHHRLGKKPVLTLKDLDSEPMILYPNAPLPGLAQEVMSAFRSEGVRLVIEQEVEDVVTAVALVAGGFGLCVTTESASNLRLPGVVYKPLRSRVLKDIELSCLYRRDDQSQILQAFLNVARQGAQLPLRRR
ncbi:LysR substrate-binding domain-containing protein [Cupriavidus sp. 2TAF22]|uniref:LysR substrate-binding domain-containing protein n=1 Tax=unclassified Cupriavidus TaxID=2640874 RepID=UPI003F8EFF56